MDRARADAQQWPLALGRRDIGLGRDRAARVIAIYLTHAAAFLFGFLTCAVMAVGSRQLDKQ